MSLTKQQIAELHTEKKLKGITNLRIAKETGLNPASVSRFFNFKLTLSEAREREIIDYINNTPLYENIRVEVK